MMRRDPDGTETMSRFWTEDSRPLERAYKVLVEVRVEERCMGVGHLLYALEAGICGWEVADIGNRSDH